MSCEESPHFLCMAVVFVLSFFSFIVVCLGIRRLLHLLHKREEVTQLQHQVTFRGVSPAAPSRCLWKYDVFLSFRGVDVRKGFLSHLYKALTDNGIHTFRDDTSEGISSARRSWKRLNSRDLLSLCSPRTTLPLAGVCKSLFILQIASTRNNASNLYRFSSELILHMWRNNLEILPRPLLNTRRDLIPRQWKHGEKLWPK